MTALDTKTALNIDVKMPRQCTTAKPLIVPVPNANKASPAINVVTLESRMVAHACRYPASIATCGLTLFRNSSLILSLISTFESIAIPNANAIAAIPGKVNVACKIDKQAVNNIRLIDKENIEISPNT